MPSTDTERLAAERRAAEQRTAERRAAERGAAEQRTAEQRVAERRAVARHAAGYSAVEPGAVEPGAVEPGAVQNDSAESRDIEHGNPARSDTAPTGADGIELRFETVHPNDARAQPVLQDLVREYGARYDDIDGHDARAEVYSDLEAYTSEHGGVFILLLRGAEPIAAGAGKRFDVDTIELKKIWTTPSRRGQRLGALLLAELECTARDLGYRKVFLTTGPRQPEADRLYERSGYTPHFSPGAHTVHPYTKALSEDADGTALPKSLERLGLGFDELVRSRAATPSPTPPSQRRANTTSTALGAREGTTERRSPQDDAIAESRSNPPGLPTHSSCGRHSGVGGPAPR